VPTRDDNDDNDGDEEEDTEKQLRSQGKGKQADEEAEPDSVPQSTSRRIPSAHSSSPHVQHRGGYASGQVSGASSPMPTLHFPLATPPIRRTFCPYRGHGCVREVLKADSQLITHHTTADAYTEGEAFSFGDSLDRIKREDKKALLAQLEQTTHCTSATFSATFDICLGVSNPQILFPCHSFSG
jgi:hypothetical protein